MATEVEGDPEAPFSLAAETRCRGRVLLFSLDHSTLPLILLYNAECYVRRRQVPFLSL